jgi:hypothetical protein
MHKLERIVRKANFYISWKGNGANSFFIHFDANKPPTPSNDEVTKWTIGETAAGKLQILNPKGAPPYYDKNGEMMVLFPFRFKSERNANTLLPVNYQYDEKTAPARFNMQDRYDVAQWDAVVKQMRLYMCQYADKPH